jgi:hypothetical protein
VKFAGVKLDDSWAEWVDLGIDDKHEDRASLEEVFVGIIGKPIAQILIEGRVGDEVWAVVLAHLCEFQMSHSNQSGVRLRGIHQGISSSALYLEAEHEISLAAYLAEFADIIGKGSVELFERLASAVADRTNNDFKQGNTAATTSTPFLGFAAQAAISQPTGVGYASDQIESRVAALQRSPFWASEKAVLIMTGHRQIWLEATSNPSLTLRPPHGSAVGVDLIRGHFVTDELRRNKILSGRQ